MNIRIRWKPTCLITVCCPPEKRDLNNEMILRGFAEVLTSTGFVKNQEAKQQVVSMITENEEWVSHSMFVMNQ